MAARINTKFFLRLIIVVGIVGSAIGGWMIYRIKTDATGKIAMAEEFLSEGDYRNAEKFFGRAVGVEPGNLEFVARWEDALTKIVPLTDKEARELYLRYLAIRQYPSDQYPYEAEWHLYFIEEVAAANKRFSGFGAVNYDRAATNMIMRIMDPDPAHMLGQLHRGLARFAPRNQSSFDESDLKEGEIALEKYLKSDPTHAEAWSALVRGRLAETRRLAGGNQPIRANESYGKTMRTLEEARTHVGNTPYMALAELDVALYDQMKDGPLDEERVRRHLGRLTEGARELDDPILLEAIATVAQHLAGVETLPPSTPAFDAYLSRNPADLMAMLQAGIARRAEGDTDGSTALFRRILESERLPVSNIAQFQTELESRAAQQIVLTELVAWETADTDEARALAIDNMKAAREALLERVSDPDRNARVIDADARIAFAMGNYARASALFDRLVIEFGTEDIQTLMTAALSFERDKQFGRALTHVERGLDAHPSQPLLLERKAIYQHQLRRLDEALATARLLAQVAPQNTRAPLIIEQIEAQLAAEGGAAAPTDSVFAALDRAQRAADGRRYDEALEVIREAQVAFPDDPRLAYGLLIIEWDHGDRDVAKEILADGLARFPENDLFLTFERRNAIDDPVDRVISDAEASTSTPTEQALQILSRLHVARREIEAAAVEADLAGDAEEAARLRGPLPRVDAVMAEQRTYLDQNANEDPQYVDFRYGTALEARDWDAIERLLPIGERVNADQADGLLYRGRYELVRGELAAAEETLEQAVERVPFNARAHLWLAQTREQLGRNEEALASYAAAYDNNPSDLAVIFPYVKLLELTGSRDRALAILQNARRMIGRSDAVAQELRSRWLRLEGLVGDPAVVLRERRDMHANRRAVIAQDRAAQQNARGLIEILLRQVPAQNTILDETGAHKYTAREWSRLTAADREVARSSALSDWNDEVDALIEDLAEPMGAGLDWRVLKANVLRIRGEVDAGELVLREYVDSASEPAERLGGNIQLAVYLQAVDQVPEAIEALREARADQDPARLEADRAMASMMLTLRQYERALELYRTIQSTTPSSDIEFTILRCLGTLGRIDEARAMLDRMTIDPDDAVTVAILDATLTEVEIEQAASRGDHARSDERYEDLGRQIERLRELAPANAVPYVINARRLLGRARRTGDGALLEQALREIDSAGRRAVNTGGISLLRIEILLEQGNRGQAILEYQTLLALSPDHKDSRLALVNLLVEEGRTSDAVGVIGEAVERSPASAFWHERYADLIRRVDGDAKIAVDHYKRALESTRSAAIVGKLAESLLGLEPPDARGALRYLREYEDVLQSDPRPVSARARAKAILGDDAGAREDLRLAYQKRLDAIEKGQASEGSMSMWITAVRDVVSPTGDFTAEHARQAESIVRDTVGGDLDIYELRSLALLWFSAGAENASHAVDLQRQALSLAVGPLEGARVELLFGLGSMLHAAGQTRAALDAFEEIVRIDPNNAQALNNSAYFLSESLDDPAAALVYARRAVDLRPGDWSMLDTLGWILYRTGDYAEAKQHLFRSVEIHESAVNTYHLAAVYAKEGDRGSAHRYIRRALQLNPDSATKAEIDRLADDI